MNDAVAQPVDQALMQLAMLAKLRETFPANQVSKLPKPTKAQTEEVRADFKKGVRCTVCGSWHHPQVAHLDYVGHAALTDRLLNVDPFWSWEPLAYRDGLPAFDQSGGLWIKLTVCGVTRLGYGHAAAKSGQDPGAREKEVIGDALRNAGMRFGAALDLWHKGDLHVDAEDEASAPAPATQQYEADRSKPRTAANGVKRVSSAEAKRIGLDKKIKDAIEACADLEALELLEADFDLLTQQAPLSWLDSIRNQIILQREELQRAEQYGAEFDQAFAGAVGPRQPEGATA